MNDLDTQIALWKKKLDNAKGYKAYRDIKKHYDKLCLRRNNERFRNKRIPRE